MRHAILVITSILGAALAIGCASRNNKSAAEPKPSETAAAEEKQDYTYPERAAFVEKTKKELAEIEKELDRLSDKVEKTSGEAKADAKVKLEAVRKKWTEVKKQLDEAGSATEAAWNDVKVAFKKAYGELKDSFDKTRQSLSDKIEP